MKKGKTTILTYQPTLDPFIAGINLTLVRDDPLVRVSKTPFGPIGPGNRPIIRYYLGAAVPWKRNPAARPEGVKKRNKEFAKEVRKHKRLHKSSISEKISVTSLI